MGAAILGMGAIIGEKQSGSAAWVLSKPLSRSAFVSAKLVALTVGVVSVAIVLQGVVAFGQIAAVSRELPGLVPFTIGLGVLALHTMFYLTLVVMLGTFLNSRGAVVGIALGILFGQQLAGNLLARWLCTCPAASAHWPLLRAWVSRSRPSSQLPLQLSCQSSSLQPPYGGSGARSCRDCGMPAPSTGGCTPPPQRMGTPSPASHRAAILRSALSVRSGPAAWNPNQDLR